MINDTCLKKAKKDMGKRVSVSAVILIWAVFGGVFYLMPQSANSQHRYYSDYAQYDRSSEIRYYIDRINERIWQLQNRLNQYPDNYAREELNKLLDERESLYRQLEPGYQGRSRRY